MNYYYLKDLVQETSMLSFVVSKSSTKCRSDLSRGLSHFLGFVKKQRTNGKKDNMFVSRLPYLLLSSNFSPSVENLRV